MIPLDGIGLFKVTLSEEPVYEDQKEFQTNLNNMLGSFENRGFFQAEGSYLSQKSRNDNLL